MLYCTIIVELWMWIINSKTLLHKSTNAALPQSFELEMQRNYDINKSSSLVMECDMRAAD